LSLSSVRTLRPKEICHARLNKNAGTSSIVDEKTHEPLIDILSLIVKTAVQLHKDGHKVIIVSSGAIGVGLRRMDVEKRPKYLPRIQVSIPLPYY
jgi:glutamate 5-kinase